jgi:hypothetical protein
MPFEKCPHCKERIPPLRMRLHLKRCPKKRRKDAIKLMKRQKSIYAKDQKRIDAEVLEIKKKELAEEKKQLEEKQKLIDQTEKGNEK